MLLDETRCNRSTWSNLQMMQKETDQDDTVWKCKEFHKMQQSTNARKIYTTAMKDWRRILLQLYVLFCACLCFILCTSVCNVEYFLEVGVYLSQGRFQTTLQITKQLQWRRQCAKEKTKVEEEGVIGKCADSVNRARKSYDECFNNLLYVFV